MTSKFETPREWLEWHVAQEGADPKAMLLKLAHKVDFDTIQECFEQQMDQDGYFDDEDDEGEG